VIGDDKTIKISGHNGPFPTEYTTLLEGDPRITANRGELIDLSKDIHAEQSVITEAARHGISLEGLSMVVSMFPCPICAKLIAASGIKSCYFVEGYATLDGQKDLKDAGVEIVRIDTELEPEDPRSLKPYPTKS
jgi:dCMP deaminase